MLPNRIITSQDDQALINTVIKYLQGDDLKTIKNDLEQQCSHFDTACKDRYEAITSSAPEFQEKLGKILDELSIGGRQLHFMTTDQARRNRLINCYVWDDAQLFYISTDFKQKPETIQIIETKKDVFLKLITTIKPEGENKTVHLHAFDIHRIISSNTSPSHVPSLNELDERTEILSSDNFYIALKKLKHKHRHLALLTDMIDNTKPARNWALYVTLAAGLSAVIGLFFYIKENVNLVKAWFERTWPLVSSWLGSTLNILRNTPFIGVFSHAIPLIASWYHALTDVSGQDPNKRIMLIFKTLEHVLPMTGYIVFYLSAVAGAMPPAALALFITGSLVDVIEPLYTLIKDNNERAKTLWHPLGNTTAPRQKLERNNFMI